MRRLLLSVLVATSMAAPLVALPAVQAAGASGPYLTLLFSRTEETAADYAGGQCTRNDTNIAVLDGTVAPYLQQLGLTATGSIETRPTQQSSYWCAHYHQTLASSWDLASQLSTQYGWTFASHSATYPSPERWSAMTPAQQWDETCGSAQVIDQHGLTGADTFFAWPHNKINSTALNNYVKPCFGTSRIYGGGITSAAQLTTDPYTQSTAVLNGGKCSNTAAPCSTLATNTKYVNPNNIITKINNLKPGQWYTLQQYLFVTNANPVYGANPDQWDCTSADPANHWTNDAERYCWVDAQAVYRAIATRASAGSLVVTNPGAVEAAFGRTGYSDRAVPRPGSVTCGQSSSATEWQEFRGDESRNGLSTGAGRLSPQSASQLSQAWRTETASFVFSSPAVSGGRVFVGDGSGKVYAMDLVTGRLIWTYQTGKDVRSSPAVANGIVYIGSNDKNLYALRASDGTLVWKRAFTGLVTSSPLVSGSTVYVSGGHDTAALNATTGAVKWTTALGGALPGSPSLSGNVIVTGAFDSTINALDATTGTRLWTFTTNLAYPQNYSTPAIRDGIVYVGAQDRKFYALDLLTGNVVWSFATTGPNPASAALAGNRVFVTSNDKHVYALDATTGALQWTAVTGKFIDSSPAYNNGVIYVGSDDSNVYAFDAATGARLWKQPVLDWVMSSPAVTGDFVVVGAGRTPNQGAFLDHAVYGFTVPC